MMKKSQKAQKSSIKPKASSDAFAFTRDNYKWVLIGLVFIAVGFVLMIGGGSDDPNVYSDKVFNFQRWTLAPLLVLIGYGIEIYAIMKKSVD
jgi:hypothetical protein